MRNVRADRAGRMRRWRRATRGHIADTRASPRKRAGAMTKSPTGARRRLNRKRVAEQPRMRARGGAHNKDLGKEREARRAEA